MNNRSVHVCGERHTEAAGQLASSSLLSPHPHCCLPPISHLKRRSVGRHQHLAGGHILQADVQVQWLHCFAAELLGHLSTEM
ncbi:hypothetical protein TGME49_253670 [Toxoplasma gondii ME49]|uniref:Uncharacterized protein n=1 Tax=Toxoplasma gondii (strain ATCC 50611 / Me49) TaxID=508771 RepID=S8FDN0_TOXGM|nr:hypothetical protein TGME49_253670 [Toxoplasma gondii ME49]EPT31793.1 hypothetical protein TGME49_253670 [Toxoplasma gondii ME49]|eukprot:XP_018638174.1 hypothetical protein TGME49_253670 [Toxoplasma gondii ME49]